MSNIPHSGHPTSNTTPYLPWADLIRIIAACWVVIVHSLTLASGNSVDEVLTLVVFIMAKTGVPLFVMLSGALLLPKVESFQVFMSKRTRRILIPWVLATLLFTAEKFLADPALHLSLRTFLVQFKHTFTAEFTFIPVIFCLYLLMPIFRNIVYQANEASVWYLVGLWILGVSVLPHTRDSLAFPLSVDNGLVRQTLEYSGYIFLGLLLSRRTYSAFKLRLSVMLCALGISITFWLAARTQAVGSSIFNYTAPQIILSSSALFTALKMLGERFHTALLPWRSVLQPLSQVSLGVFFIHPLVLKYVKMTFSQINLAQVPPTFTESLMIASLTIIVSFSLLVTARQISLRLKT